MIGVSVVFDYDGDFDRDRVINVAQNARAMFEGMPGLRFKFFTLDEKQQRAANFYVWDTTKAADGFFTDELRERVTELGAVLAAEAPGRPGPEAVTLFDSTGLAIQDLAVAGAAFEAWREGRVQAQTVRL